LKFFVRNESLNLEESVHQNLGRLREVFFVENQLLQLRNLVTFIESLVDGTADLVPDELVSVVDSV
jgi:hypothetical protein